MPSHRGHRVHREFFEKRLYSIILSVLCVLYVLCGYLVWKTTLRERFVLNLFGHFLVIDDEFFA
jgi:hypothetical protein